MDELIEKLTSQLGIDASTAQGVTGKAMSLIKDNVDDSTFSQLASSLPGLESVMGAAESDDQESAGGGGLMGSLAGMAGGLLGGNAGNAMEMGAALTEKGLPTDKLGDFVTMLVGFIKEKAGDQVLEQVYAKFPILKSLLGSQ